jgi:hypothetical protein
MMELKFMVLMDLFSSNFILGIAIIVKMNGEAQMKKE